MGMMYDLFSAVPDAAEQEPSLQAHQSVMLDSATDFAGFRQHARSLLSTGIPPDQISWHQRNGDTATAVATDAAPGSAVSVPPDFLELCQTLILHSDPQRFGLMYRLLWRMAHEPGLRHDPLDADRVQACLLADAVRQDIQKMKTSLRFRSIKDEVFRARPLEGPLHVAWFEPEHHIVEAITPFFARRFTQMRWAILTPERSVRWDGTRARFGPGAQGANAPPADAGEHLWLTDYQHIFNPARLKLKMTQKEMPRKYWHKPPEASLMSGLSASANQRQMNMVSGAPGTPHRRIPAFRPQVLRLQGP
ncbi:MAG: TIGR03915 family putative DNA repair protein [Pseudomonadota bacterium]